MSYSQTDEQEVLAGLLPDTGRFLDIGAHDGQTFSNTLALAEQGWSGVCVEPSPGPAVGLRELHCNRPIEVVLAAVVVGTPSWETFWDSKPSDMLSTLDEKHRDHRSDTTYQPFVLRTVSLAQLFERVGFDFDFVSIDTEGSSVDLAEALPIERMPALRAVCVEHDRDFKLPGFTVAHKTPDNVILRNEEP